MSLRFCLAAGALLGSSLGAFAGTGTAEFTASVSSSGTVKGGSGVQAATKTGEGVYQVAFPRAVDTCIAQAALKEQPGFIVATSPAAGSSTLLVKTFNTSAKAKSFAFTVLVKCQD